MSGDEAVIMDLESYLREREHELEHAGDNTGDYMTARCLYKQSWEIQLVRYKLQSLIAKHCM